MAFITLELAKKHLNVEHEEDDAYILSLVEVAEEQVEQFINRPLRQVMVGDALPAPLRHAMLLVVGRLYQDREGMRQGRVNEIPFTLASLFLPYRLER